MNCNVVNRNCGFEMLGKEASVTLANEVNSFWSPGMRPHGNWNERTKYSTNMVTNLWVDYTGNNQQEHILSLHGEKYSINTLA